MSKSYVSALVVSLILLGCGPDLSNVSERDRHSVVDAGTSEFFDTGANSAPQAVMRELKMISISGMIETTPQPPNEMITIETIRIEKIKIVIADDTIQPLKTTVKA